LKFQEKKGCCPIGECEKLKREKGRSIREEEPDFIERCRRGICSRRILNRTKNLTRGGKGELKLRGRNTISKR